MMKLTSFIMVALFTIAALGDTEVPLPPPSGPGGGNPGTPQPTPSPTPRPHRPPPDNPPPPPPEDNNPPPPYEPPPQQPPPQQPQPPSTQPGREYSYTLGDIQTTRVATREYRLYPRSGLTKISALRVTGTLKKVNINSVRISYSDGYGDQTVSGLSGSLAAGESRTIRLSGARVSVIVISASNSAFWRKAGAFRVDASAVAE